MISLERLQVYDITQVIEVAKEFNKTYSGNKNFLDEGKARNLLELSTIMTRNYYCLVKKDEDKVVGFLFGVCYPGPFFSQLVAAELGWFVLQEYRDRSSIVMIKEFEKWAKEEAKAEYVALTYTEEMSNLDKVYRRLGYQQTEVTYKKSLL
jgi:hypothetical protein